MNTKNKTLQILQNQTEYISGERLAKEVGVTRTAIWKAINSLRSSGYIINSTTNRGYKLVSDNSNINNIDIYNKIDNKNILIKVIDTTTSTNDYIKKYLNENLCVVISKTQTDGRGRLDRKFYSPNGCGVYMSILIKPPMAISDGVKITTFTAVAVARAIESLAGQEVKIKWVNDLFMKDKKVCGILTEASCDFELGVLKHAIIGIGINVYGNNFPNYIKDIATSIESVSNKKIDCNLLIAKILDGIINGIDELLSGSYLNEYKKRSLILNREVTIKGFNSSYKAIAKDITPTGALVVVRDGKEELVYSGDVSVRI